MKGNSVYTTKKVIHPDVLDQYVYTVSVLRKKQKDIVYTIKKHIAEAKLQSIRKELHKKYI